MDQICLYRGEVLENNAVSRVDYKRRSELHQVFNHSDTMPPGGIENDSLSHDCRKFTLKHTDAVINNCFIKDNLDSSCFKNSPKLSLLYLSKHRLGTA